MKKKFTHKGWIGFAPIYISDIERTDGGLQIAARLPWLEWTISVSAFIFQMIGAEYFPIKITGELVPPIFLELNGKRTKKTLNRD